MIPSLENEYEYDKRVAIINARNDWVAEQVESDPDAIRLRSFLERLEDWHHSIDSILRGFVLVKSGLYRDGSWSQVECMEVMQFNKFQREYVDQNGHCFGGCSLENHRETEFGESLCSLTHQPCKLLNLHEIILAISEINKPKDPKYDVKGLANV